MTEKVNLQLELKKEGELIQSFKDPEGMTAFRLVLQDMEAGIKALQKEKKAQYEAMNQSLKLMEGLEKASNISIEDHNHKLEQKDK